MALVSPNTGESTWQYLVRTGSRLHGQYQQGRRYYNQARALADRGRQVFDDLTGTRNYTETSVGRGPNGRRPYRRMPYYGSAGGYSSRSNRIYYRKRRGRRRRLRWSTRVRRAALRLGEGKRVGLSNFTTYVARAQNTIHRFELLSGFRMMTGTEVNVDQTPDNTTNNLLIRGNSTRIRGIKVHMLLRNTSATNPVDFRIICGWLKRQPQGTAVEARELWIFKDKATNQGAQLLANTWAGTNASYETPQVPVDRNIFYVAKDMVVRLGQNSAGTSDEGPGSKKIQFWWEMNYKQFRFDQNITVASGDQTEANANFYPCIYVYHATSNDVANTNADCLCHWLVYHHDINNF